MSTTRLLVLGCVRERARANGYQVRCDLEDWGAHLWANVKRGSVYHALGQLHREGLLDAEEETQESARATPTVTYRLSEAGASAFLDLLRSSLASHDSDLDLLTAAVGFITVLPRSEAIALLRARSAAFKEWRESIQSMIDRTEQDWQHHIEALRLWMATAESGDAWTVGLIDRLAAGEYDMSSPQPSSQAEH